MSKYEKKEVKPLTEDQKNDAEKFEYLLNALYKENKVYDDDIRCHIQYRYIQAVSNYNEDKGLSKEDYLCICIQRSYKQYWIDKIIKAKKNEERVLDNMDTEEVKNLMLIVDHHFDDIIESDSKEYVRLMYNFLSWTQHQVIYYIFYVGMTEAETANKLGNTKQNINKILKRIIERFKNSFLFDFGSKDSVKIMENKDV